MTGPPPPDDPRRNPDAVLANRIALAQADRRRATTRLRLAIIQKSQRDRAALQRAFDARPNAQEDATKSSPAERPPRLT